MKALTFICRTRFLFMLAITLALPARSALAEEYVCFDTNHGDICFTLFPQTAPLTVANFLRYVDRGAYSNTLVHRSVPGFVIQGGGFSGEPAQNRFSAPIAVDPPVVNESARSNLRGTLAMARTSDPNSATSQWFINLADNTGLDGSRTTGYTVFGAVAQGMDVVDKIAALRVGDFSFALNNGAFTNMPVDMAPNETDADFADFVVVERAYRTERLPGLLPYQCSLASPGDTMTEFCGSTVSFPVQIDGVLYEGTLNYLPGRSGIVFAVDRSKLKTLADTGQARATFSAGLLTLPSLRYGSQVLTNVRLDLTNRDSLEFTVRDFSR